MKPKGGKVPNPTNQRKQEEEVEGPFKNNHTLNKIFEIIHIERL